MASKEFGALVVAVLMVLGAFAVVGSASGAGAAHLSGPVLLTSSGSPAASSAAPNAVSAPAASAVPSTSGPAGVDCSALQTVANDPSYSSFVNNVQSIGSNAVAAGLPSGDLHLPYAGEYPTQFVNGQQVAGTVLDSECSAQNGTDAPEPTGVSYDGKTDISGIGSKDLTLDSSSVAGILTVNSTQSFYPNSGTPTQWGGQLNVVLPNVTILGDRAYTFWVQNVISYDTFNDTISFVDDTWNFTNGNAEMFSSSLVGWSPNGGNYTGVWVAFSPYIYAPPPFTVTVYVNTSVNAQGNQVLWYNYSLLADGHFYANGNYDYLIFNSQPKTGGPLDLSPPLFEASASARTEVPEGYEFDAFIGADDGSNNMDLVANATEQVQYCSVASVPVANVCTPTDFAYANVPAAVNYGSQTGEETVGIAVNYVGTTAYLSAGTEIEHGLWNYTGQAGVEPGNTAVVNAIDVMGAPLAPLPAQPYVFVWLENTAITSQGYQWAPDVPVWYLMPGTYDYEIMLADYTQQNGTLTVGSTATSLSATLPYNPTNGVYTPLFAMNNAQLAGISTSGDGTVNSQYVLFNNPTTTAWGRTPANLSSVFYSDDDYDFPSFPGLFLSGTSAYVDANALPTFAVHQSTSRGVTTTYYLNLQVFETSHVTISNDTAVRGWPAMEEISFYETVPASQNPAPQAQLYVWNSTHDLVMGNHFIATKPGSGFVAMDLLVLYGGGDNVVWGNTFSDPPGVAMGSTYAGIGLAESGDLIYNNNFSVDNPVVYLPYNWVNTADCLPQTLGGCANDQPGNGWYYNTVASATWNITPQAASNVANVVNGFPLSGNVLGPSVTTQGGNYFWNLGTSPNNRTTTPYVSRFYYSDWSWVFPLGCGTIQAPGAPCGTEPNQVGSYQNGITVGGDYAPYGPSITFTETGLAPGGSWAVSLDGRLYVSTSSSMTFTLTYGAYTYSVAALAGGLSASPASGTVTASGGTTVHVTFAAPTPMYNVYFTESGLAPGIAWAVYVNGVDTDSGNQATLVVSLAPGNYTITYGYGGSQYALPPSLQVTVVSAPLSFGVNFVLTTYTVTFSETGLAPGTLWAVQFGGVIYSSASGTITFTVAPGTYGWIIGSIPSETPNTSMGTAVVSGPTTVDIVFT